MLIMIIQDTENGYVTIELRHRFVFVLLVFGHTQHLQAAS